MKSLLCLVVTVALASCVNPKNRAEQPAYISEAPLPQGWPVPGPYDRVTLKSYPPYRAAFTRQGHESFAFWKLFNHIQKNDIPMTAPVEMPMNESGTETAAMAFLYQNKQLGEKGPAGEAIEIRDVPAAKALSYTWQGQDSKAEIVKAKQALDTVLNERNQKAKSFRLLGYNGPGTPSAKRTWELQALLK